MADIRPVLMVPNLLMLRLCQAGAATVWFGDEVVFGPSADVGTWWHPAYDCGRDEARF